MDMDPSGHFEAGLNREARMIDEPLDMEDEMTANATSKATDAGAVADWENPLVQTVYRMLCNDIEPPNGEHWEGFVARRIVAALYASTTPTGIAAQPVATADAVRGIVARFHRNACYPDAMPHELDAVVAALTAPVAGASAVTSMHV